MPRAFVVGATLPRGGAYMAYHIGRILHRHFGYAPVEVEIQRQPRLFTYDTPFAVIPLAALAAHITAEDILIANPSFSPHMFGLRLPGRKIMYVQDFRTFSYLDCHFDLYVSVSSVVQGFLRATYGLETSVIPAFFQLDGISAPVPWEARAPGAMLVRVKDRNFEHDTVLAWLRHALAGLPLSLHESVGFERPHAEFLNELGRARYLLNLSIAEGFGLVPLEAMAMGVCVTGLDGLAGRDYMRFGENSMAVSARELTRLPGILAGLLADEAHAKTLAAQGKKDAQAYGYPAFRDAWVGIFSRFLGRQAQ